MTRFLRHGCVLGFSVLCGVHGAFAGDDSQRINVHMKATSAAFEEALERLNPNREITQADREFALEKVINMRKHMVNAMALIPGRVAALEQDERREAMLRQYHKILSNVIIELVEIEDTLLLSERQWSNEQVQAKERLVRGIRLLRFHIQRGHNIFRD